VILLLNVVIEIEINLDCPTKNTNRKTKPIKKKLVQ
jgi:hypothetical protein